MQLTVGFHEPVQPNLQDIVLQVLPESLDSVYEPPMQRRQMSDAVILLSDLALDIDGVHCLRPS